MVMRGSSPLMAFRAALALNTGEWLRLGLLGIVHTPPGLCLGAVSPNRLSSFARPLLSEPWIQVAGQVSIQPAQSRLLRHQAPRRPVVLPSLPRPFPAEP